MMPWIHSDINLSILREYKETSRIYFLKFSVLQSLVFFSEGIIFTEYHIFLRYTFLLYFLKPEYTI